MKPLRIVTFVIAVIFALVAIGLVVGGGALTWAHTTQRDADGFLMSPDYELSTDSYALVSEEFDLASRPGDWWPGDLADVRLDVSSAGAVFAGIGPADDVAGYLAGVGYTEVTDLGETSTDVRYRAISGDAPTVLPGDADFWVASSEGLGLQSLTWDVAQGEWTLLVMNADGSQDVTVNGQVGVKIGVLLAVGIGLLIGGLLLGALATAGLVWAVSADKPREGELAPTRPTPGRYPASLQGELAPDLSRWLWLVKWVLAIPHFIVLTFLWIAYAFVTFLAFFAILFTGRYPKGMFDFNVGVLRWTWRVSFYATSAIGTDVYPPFTLSEDIGYPANFDVAYPEQLSRGLVLVKWWLLAIPQYLIVGVFTSGLIWWTTEVDGNGALQVGGGLIGLLVLIAGVALLFTRRYPQGLFDLVMGLNRWVYRVVAYVGLMTDEYPPFRLDLGGSEPGADPSGGPGGPPTDAPSREPVLTG